MWRKYWLANERLLILADVACAVVGVCVAIRVRSSAMVVAILGPIDPFDTYLPVLYFVIPVWFILRLTLADYGVVRCDSGASLEAIIGFSAIAIMGLSAVMYVAKYYALNRTLVVFFGPVNVLLMWAVRTLLRGYRTTGGRLFVVVGCGEEARRAASDCLSGDRLASVVGYVTAANDGDARGLVGPVLGEVGHIREVVTKYAVDEVVIPGAAVVELPRLMVACRETGVACRLALGGAAGRPGSVWVEGGGSVVFGSESVAVVKLALKQLIDYVVAAVLLVCLAPVFLVIAVAITLDSPGAVFFRHRRVGLNGRPFWCYKFRSMVANAEARQKELAPFNLMTGGALFKMDGDPRVTRVGGILRRTSLDELPQLWNILRGDMSLVGPRALSTPLDAYQPAHRRRLSMKSGITCLWQVRRRWDVDYAAWMEADLEYVDHWSLTRDGWILLATCWVVLTRIGAR